MAGYIGSKTVNLSTTGADIDGNITISGNVDGRDVAALGTKLDTVEANAKDDQTAAEIRALVAAASDSNVFTDADHSKLNGLEATGDVTDATNVAAAGALMRSGGAMTGAITTNSTFDGVDIATRDAVLTSTTTTANAAMPKSGGAFTGNVGIGVSPSYKLDIESSGTLLNMNSTNSNGIGTRYGNSGTVIGYVGSSKYIHSGAIGDFGIGTASTNNLTFGVNSSEKMRIASNGYISMAGAADVRLTLGSQGTEGNNDANWVRGNGTSLSYNAASANHIWEIGGTERMRISSTGDTTINGKVTLTPSGYVSGVQNLASINISSAGGGETRAIDIDGSWTAGESKSINWIHGNSSADFMGSIDCSYNGTGGILKFGRLYYNGNSSAYPMSLTATSTTTANLSVTGAVAIGNSSPSAFLDIVANSGTRLIETKSNVSDQYHHVFLDPSDNIAGTIRVTNGATTFNTSSDYRLKTDVQPMASATERIKQLNAVNFAWIASGTRVDGFLAHEAQSIVPEAVTGTKDEVDDDGVAVMQGIDHSMLVPLLVKTIQELEARITALEA